MFKVINKQRLIMYILGIFFMCFFMFGVYNVYGSDEIGVEKTEAASAVNDTKSNKGSNVWISIYAAVFMPLFVIYTSNTPQATVNNILYTCKSVKGDDRAKKLNTYVSEKFRQSEDFIKLTATVLERARRIDVKKETGKAQVTANLKDGKVYTFIMVKKDPKVDGKAKSAWLADEIRGDGFNDSIKGQNE